MKKVAKTFLQIPAILVLIILRMVRPYLRVELCVVAYHRLGHLALEPESFLALQNTKSYRNGLERGPKRIYIWNFGPKRLQANNFLASRWKSMLFTPPSWLVGLLQNAGDNFTKLRLNSVQLSIYGPENSLDFSAPRLTLLDEEKKNGKKLLEEFGIDPDIPIVCLVNRDGNHYKSRGEIEVEDYSILNFDISIFDLTVRSLVGRGYQVVRMGAGSEKPFNLAMSGFFDYAVSNNRSEFLDVYLASLCKFAVSTQTGPDALCLAFRKPVCYVDTARFSQMFLGTKLACWSPVEIYQSGERLSLREISSGEIGWIKDLADFKRLNIDVVRSSPETIDRYVRGYVDCLESGFALSKDDLTLITKANEILSVGLGEKGRMKFGNIAASLNPVFLRENSSWFLA